EGDRPQDTAHPGGADEPADPAHRPEPPAAPANGDAASRPADGPPPGHPGHAAGPSGDATARAGTTAGRPPGAAAEPHRGARPPEPEHPEDAAAAAGPTKDPEPVSPSTSPPRPSLLRDSGTMALASLVSRVTGFARQLALVAALGLLIVNDSYTVANTLPN